MNRHSLDDLQQGAAATTDARSGSSIRTQQAILTALFSAAHVQFFFASDLIEDVSEVLRNVAPDGDRASVVQTLVTRFHDRTEQTIAELRRISDELRDNAREAAARPPAQAQATAAAAAEQTVDSRDPPMPDALAGSGG